MMMYDCTIRSTLIRREHKIHITYTYLHVEHVFTVNRVICGLGSLSPYRSKPNVSVLFCEKNGHRGGKVNF